VLRIIKAAPRYVPIAVIKRDLQMLTVRQEVRKYSVTYRQRLGKTIIPTAWQKSLFQKTFATVGLSGITYLLTYLLHRAESFLRS
jgi:hypothetical protein